MRLEEERLRVADRLGADGLWVVRARSFTVDLVVRTVFEHIAASVNVSTPTHKQSGLAIIALGGYGRSELAPFSDLDALFLGTDRGFAQTSAIRERCQHLLWDAGLNLGQKSCALSQCIPTSLSDPHFQTALVNARLIAGDRALFDQLGAGLKREQQKNGRLLLATVSHERDQRYEQRGAAICLQEPNVKESAGGLRDLHSALWAVYAASGLRTLEELSDQELIETDDYQRVSASYSFLLRVRGHAHWITGRKTDHLALDLQETVACKLGYSSSSNLQASERLMRDYYRHARELHQFSESLFARSVERIDRTRRWFAPARRKRLEGNFSLKDRQLHFDGKPSLFAEDPALLFRAVALAQTNHAVFSRDLHDGIRRNLAAVDRGFRSSKEASRLFLSVLQRAGKVGRALRIMHEAGLLGRYLPEFERISMLIQHDLYHQFTVDEHTLRAIEALDELHRNTERSLAPLRAILDQVEDVGLLYLALLLHDLGKADVGSHIPRGTVIAGRICDRIDLDIAHKNKVMLLVKHHVTMAHISQRRDLREPRLAKHFARQIGDLDVLNMLVLLTYADLNGVGPSVWSDWKGDLLTELYTRTRAVLTGEASPLVVANKLERTKARVIDSLVGKVAISEIERHFALSPARYTEEASAEQVESHLGLISKLENDSLACLRHDREDFATELTICARDRRGLFADIAGVLAANGIEILSADVNTREDGIALDTFILRQATTHRSVDRHRWHTIERSLRAAINGEHDVAALVERWRTQHAPRRAQAQMTTKRVGRFSVVCDNEVAEATTLVEVCAPDEQGLAYKIAGALTAFGLDIVCARVATEKSNALDVFYVTKDDGSKLDETESRELKEAIANALFGMSGRLPVIAAGS